MNFPTLLFSTNNPTIDRVVSGLVALFEHIFPNRISGYYLLGSYANGTSLPSSDLDMVMLFRDRFLSDYEFTTAVAINESCKLIAPVLLDAWVISDERTQQPTFIGDTLELKQTGRLIYGLDTRQTITAQPDAAYIRWAMDVPVYPITAARNGQGIVTVPLTYPDPNGRWYGYDQWSLTLANGQQVPGTKLLVATVGRIASALISAQTGQFVGSKRDCVDLYRQHINDEWTNLVVQVYELCRNRWGYRIPKEERAKEQLRDLCQHAVGFENHFLATYKTHLLARLHHPDSSVQLEAAGKFGQIVYSDEEVRAALLELQTQADKTLENAVSFALQQIRAAGE